MVVIVRVCSNVFVVLIYPGDVDVGHLLDKLRNASDDRQNLSRQLGGTDLAVARRHHCDLLGLGQWGGDFGGDLFGR